MSNKKNAPNKYLSEYETLYGIHAVHAMLKTAPHKIKQLILHKNRQDHKFKEIIALAKQHHVLVDQNSFEHSAVSQGVIAILNPHHEKQTAHWTLESFFETCSNKTPLLLILDGIQDPHNLGACIRTANGAGADAVIIPADKASPLTASARKTASGAAEYTPVITVTNLSRTIEVLKEKGIWIFGLSGEAKKSLYQENFQHATAFVMGAEGTGLRHLTQSMCDDLLSIPMLGEIESLNVSVASGICLYEALRQRQPTRK